MEIFFRKGNGEVYHSKQTFVFNNEDECCFPQEDMLMKLPQPKTVGGTARREMQFIFLCTVGEFRHPLTTEQHRAYKQLASL